MHKLVLALGLLLPLAAQAETPLPIADDDAAMKAAIVAARSTLDTFIARLSAPLADSSTMLLKVQITDGHQCEHFWVNELAQDPAGFSGNLTNEAVAVKGYKLGQKVTFSRDQISDWAYRDGNKMAGGYTMCAMFVQLPPAQSAAYQKDYGLNCGTLLPSPLPSAAESNAKLPVNLQSCKGG